MPSASSNARTNELANSHLETMYINMLRNKTSRKKKKKEMHWQLYTAYRVQMMNKNRKRLSGYNAVKFVFYCPWLCFL